MKPCHLTGAAALSAALVSMAAASPPTADRVSVEELVARREAAADVLARIDQGRPVEQPYARPEHRKILAHSQILSNGGLWTLVPEGAVVHVPETLANRVGNATAGEFVPWIEFLGRNRAWLDTHEVTFEQAAGKQALPERQIEFWNQADQMIVAVHLGGPISVKRSSPNPPPTP